MKPIVFNPYMIFYKHRIEAEKKSAEKQNYERENQENTFPLATYPENYYVKYLKQTSYQEIMGYEQQKKKISEQLINPINKYKVGVPSGIIISAPYDTTGDEFVDYIKMETKANFVSLNTTPENFIKDTSKLLNKAQENYLKTGKRTIISIKNSEQLLSSENIRNVARMKSWLLVSSDEPSFKNDIAYATTFLFETEKPQALSKEVWDNAEDIVHLPLRTNKNIVKILESALEDTDLASSYEELLSNDELKTLVQQLKPDIEKGAYSDTNILNIVEKTVKEHSSNDKSLAQTFSDVIENTECDILPEIVRNSVKTTQWLDKLGLID